MRVRLAFLSGRPVYYHAPLYRRLAAEPGIDFTAIFASSAGATRPLDNGYGRPVEWGVDALGGYRNVFLRRADRNPPGGGVFAFRDLDVVTLLKRERYDVLALHGYHTVTHLAAALTQRALGGVCLFREEQTLLAPRPRWKTAVKSVALRAHFHDSYGLYIGAENRRWFARWGIPEDRLFHTPYVVDNEVLRRTAHELAPRRQQLRAEFGIQPDSGPVILTVGRLIETKQPEHVLDAFRQVRAKQQCTLLLVGSGPLEDELRNKVAAEGIPNVAFAGFLDQTQVARAYAAADLFALVSRGETWGLVVNEAMNFGLPVVVSDRVGCAADLVVSGRNGFVVPSRNRDALAQALETLVDSPETRERFGRSSLEIIEPWNYDRTAAGVVDAVAAAVGTERWGDAPARPDRGLERAVS
jgi:glycosyltransferase involved in cell wall biosynthesis